MKKNSEPHINFPAENAFKLPGIRKYLTVSDNAALQETIAFLARKNKNNDIFIKTLLTPSLEKEDDRLYYKSLLNACLKSLISQKKRKISSRSSSKITAWTEAAEEVMFNFSTSGNFRELWLFCKNIQFQFCEWINYEDITHPHIGTFLKKTQEYIELCFNETPAAQMKLEILHSESDLLTNSDFPVISAERNPVLFLLQYNQRKDNEEVIQKYIAKRRSNPLTDSREKTCLDQAEFLFNLRYKNEDTAIQKFISGHNKYNNVKYLVNFCIENSDELLAGLSAAYLFNYPLNTAFIEENILKLHHSRLIDKEVLSSSYLKLFLIEGDADYLQKAIRSGYGYEAILENMKALNLSKNDIRYIQVYLAFGKYEILESELSDPFFYTEVVHHLKHFQLNHDILKLLVSSTVNYLQNFIGPKSHEMVELFARYLKRENHGNLLKNLKELVKRNFPERKFLLKQI